MDGMGMKCRGWRGRGEGDAECGKDMKKDVPSKPQLETSVSEPLHRTHNNVMTLCRDSSP